jgi:hypothetical protein
MNRLVKMTLVVLFMGFAAAASAQTLRVTADRTNLRDKASTDGAIVVALSMGEELEALGPAAGAWYHVRVKSSGKEGYVSTLVVQVVPGTAPAGGARPAGGNAAAPTPSPAPAPAPRPAAQPAAQSSRPAPAASGGGEGFSLGYTDAGPVIGLGGISGAGAGFGGRFEKAFKDLPNLHNGVLGIGGGVDWFHWSNEGVGFGSSVTVLPISVTANYHFRLENKKIDPFVGAGLGYEYVSVNCTAGGFNYCAGVSGSTVYFVGHGGIRYFWKPNMAAYADVGAGYGALHVGLMFKLKDGQ